MPPQLLIALPCVPLTFTSAIFCLFEVRTKGFGKCRAAIKSWTLVAVRLRPQTVARSTPIFHASLLREEESFGKFAALTLLSSPLPKNLSCLRLGFLSQPIFLNLHFILRLMHSPSSSSSFIFLHHKRLHPPLFSFQFFFRVTHPLLLLSLLHFYFTSYPPHFIIFTLFTSFSSTSSSSSHSIYFENFVSVSFTFGKI